jgi:hypothetical protein
MQRFDTQMMYFVDMAIHPFVCQKSDFHGNNDFQNTQKLDPYKYQPKNFWSKYASLSEIFWCKKIDSWCITKVDIIMLFGFIDSAKTFS